MNETEWQRLLSIGINILDQANIPRYDWTFGGGTALAYRLNHRESKDIDIFLTDAQQLLYVTPRLNQKTGSISNDYEEGSTYVKLYLTEGEIDYIIAPRLSLDPYTIENIVNYNVQTETSCEVVAKKLFYRSESLKARDVIDIAAVIKSGQTLQLIYPIVKPKLSSLEWRWEHLKSSFKTEAGQLRIHDNELIEEAPKIFEKMLYDLSRD